MTKYIHELFVVVPAAEAKRLSDLFEQRCPDVGPNNFLSDPLNAAGDASDPTYYRFRAPVEPRHYAAIAPLLKATPGVKFLRTDREGNLQKTDRSEVPAARKVSDGELLTAAGLKRKAFLPPER